MALREEFRDAGDWLFRRRSYLPLLVFASLVPVMATSRVAQGGRTLELSWEALCLLISLAGEGIRVATVGFVPSGTSGGNVRGQRADHLNTSGMYSVVRHPLYLGNLLMWLGVALLPQSGWFVVTIVLAFWLYYERIMFAEEEFLRERYGDAYLEWAARTPAFLPRLSGWRPPHLPFSLKMVLRREHSSMFALVSSFAVLDLFDQYAVTGTLHVDPLWAGAFGLGLLGFLLVIALKRLGLLKLPAR